MDEVGKRLGQQLAKEQRSVSSRTAWEDLGARAALRPGRGKKNRAAHHARHAQPELLQRGAGAARRIRKLTPDRPSLHPRRADRDGLQFLPGPLSTIARSREIFRRRSLRRAVVADDCAGTAAAGSAQDGEGLAILLRGRRRPLFPDRGDQPGDDRRCSARRRRVRLQDLRCRRRHGVRGLCGAAG